MSDLKDQLIRLGSKRKDLRPHIRPVLAELEKESASMMDLHGEARGVEKKHLQHTKKDLEKLVDKAARLMEKYGLSVIDTTVWVSPFDRPQIEIVFNTEEGLSGRQVEEVLQQVLDYGGVLKREGAGKWNFFMDLDE